MTRKKWLMGFGGGLLAGMVMIFAWTGGPSAPPVAAQQPDKAATSRFQISTWSYPAANGGSQKGTTPSYGAYVVDTQNGNVWLVVEDKQPKKLGKAE